MSKKQLRFIRVLYTMILMMGIVGACVVSISVFADGHSYIYPSDIIKGKKNNEIEHRYKWGYQQGKPALENRNPYQPRYTYLPPTQKMGSNPITDPKNKTQIPSIDDPENTPGLTGEHYQYAPLTKKPGSNPFFK